MLKLYRQAEDEFAYWEAWDTGQASIVVHWGQVGTKGEQRVVPLLSGESAERRIEEEADPLRASGFAQRPDDQLVRVVVQYPPSHFTSMDEVERLWDRVERQINQTLGWNGLGRCAGVDFSSELTFIALTVSPDMATEAIKNDLAAHAHADGAVIAVEQSDHYVVVWPEDQAGSKID